ncbi:MAG: addiction module toxin RelE [Betaproteobacteria bacterium]|nr:addiction module toxin RelE [Betaproteobacteria bacterium]
MLLRKTACVPAPARRWPHEHARHHRTLGARGGLSCPNLGRPAADTLKGSRHANMKELRFDWNGEVWRVAFAFDPKRQAILLAGGDKGGADQRRFYKRLIAIADDRYDKYLATLKKESKHGKKTR